MKNPKYIEPIEQIIVKDSTGKFYRDVIHSWSDGLRWDGQDIDMPAMKEWPDKSEDYRQYLQYVAKTGDDYLCELLSVKTTEPQTWMVKVSQWIGQSQFGLMVQSARKAHRHLLYNSRAIPDEVIEFLAAEWKSGKLVMPDFKSMDALAKQHEGAEFKLVDGGLRAKLTFTVNVRRNDNRLKADVKKRAKEALKSS